MSQFRNTAILIFAGVGYFAGCLFGGGGIVVNINHPALNIGKNTIQYPPEETGPPVRSTEEKSGK
jgi:hypothetical protein